MADKSAASIEIGWREPWEVAKRLADLPGFAFLDSALFHPKLGRYSFIGVAPFGTFVVEGGKPFWNGTALDAPPLDALRRLMNRFALPHDPALPPFQGGVIGAVPYEFGWQLEILRAQDHAVAGHEPVHLAFYDLVFAFDHLDKRATIISTGLPEEDSKKRLQRAASRIEEALALLEHPSVAIKKSPAGHFDWRSNFSETGYREAVEKVRSHIYRGDIYQANIAQRFETDLPPGFSPFSFYEQLRRINPAPFGAYLSFGETAIASSSPELLLRRRGSAVEARPIKGTARRLSDPIEDARRAEMLLASEKDRAENIMIVDLLRNDLSLVSKPHSVDVPVLCGLESYANVHHLVSVVTGELDDDRDDLDLLAATFPGGSITGAPKRRAMEIIETIEKTPRGYYCGTILYMGFDGTTDMNIAIRTAVLKPGKASFHAGGGITYLSDPAAEYAETYTKAQRIFDAFAATNEAESAMLEKTSP
ncbi:MAG TPA: aminodeoxychorismate synthase component I [Methylovirgula sp.]